MRHALLVVAAQGRQLLAHLIERLAHAGDVAMAENRPDAGKDRQLFAVDHGHLPRQEARHRLRHRQSYGFCHGFLPHRAVRRHWLPSNSCQASVSAANRAAMSRDGRLVVDLAGEPAPRAASAKIVRPTAKPLTEATLCAAAKAAISSSCRAPPARAARCRGNAGHGAGSPRRSLFHARPRFAARASTSRAGCRAHKAPPCTRGMVVVVQRAVLAGDDLDQQFAARPARRLVERAQLVAPARPSARLRIVRMIEAQAFDAMVDRPFGQPPADILGELETQRTRARLLQRPRDPETGLLAMRRTAPRGRICRRSACRSPAAPWRRAPPLSPPAP